MKSVSMNRQIGSILLIMGTEIGAGMLALPILIVNIGIYIGTLVLVINWALMLYTALLVCEANSSIDGNVGFASIAKEFLGKWGKLFISVIFWCTLSSIGMAYISAAGSTFGYLLSGSNNLSSTVFVIVFAIFIILGTKYVDYLNRLLFGATLLAFFIALIMLSKSTYIINLSTTGNFSTIFYAFSAIATAFILHNIIPSIRTYLWYDQKILKRIVIIGSIIPLIIYIIWITLIIGNIPATGPKGFDILFAKGNKANISDLLNLLSLNVNNNLIMISINFVSTMSVTTSFLGTSISLYHFIQDIFVQRKKNIITHFIIPVIFTFIIPLLIVITYPDIFIAALSYAGSGAMILFVIIPVIITKKLMSTNHKFSNSILSNRILLILSFLLGLGIIFIQIF